MFNVGGGEIVVIALVALIVLGPDKLPEALRKLGQLLGEIRNVSTGFQAEMQSAMREDPMGPTPGSQELPPSLDAEATKGYAVKPADFDLDEEPDRRITDDHDRHDSDPLDEVNEPNRADSTEPE